MVLHNISWETYESILADHASSSSPRFTYDRGELEIMSPRPEHESANFSITQAMIIFAEYHRIEFESFGATTFRREDLERGFEADSCFYFRNEAHVRDMDTFDPSVDPPPDVVVEVDITHSSLPKHGVFAALGIPEVWRYDGSRLAILSLTGSKYVEIEESWELPGMSAALMTELVAARKTMSRLAWMQHVREAVRGVGA